MASLAFASPRAPVRAHTRGHSRRRGSVLTRASALNERIVQDATAAFAIPGSVRFELGEGGLPRCVLTHKNGSSAEVYLFGANVTYSSCVASFRTGRHVSIDCAGSCAAPVPLRWSFRATFSFPTSTRPMKLGLLATKMGDKYQPMAFRNIL